MDIVCCTDNNYIKYCCVMLTSLLENNKEENITIHILGDNLTSDSDNKYCRGKIQPTFVFVCCR